MFLKEMKNIRSQRGIERLERREKERKERKEKKIVDDKNKIQEFCKCWIWDKRNVCFRFLLINNEFVLNFRILYI